jgi:hypothetical protein
VEEGLCRFHGSCARPCALIHGWRLVSADVAQLEPRALAAMSGDRAMAEAGLGKDLYSGLVDAGVVATRQEAKIAVLGCDVRFDDR